MDLRVRVETLENIKLGHKVDVDRATGNWNILEWLNESQDDSRKF